MILSYFLIGVIWACWLEYFTTKHLEGPYGEDWKGRERLFHITLWPYSLGAFIYGIVEEMNNKNR